jgi:hypothetical protein
MCVSLTNRVVIDVSTGQAISVPLTAAEQAAFDAALAAAPGIEAARVAANANAATLSGNVAGALARLRQIQVANPNTVTLPQVAQAVIDLATDVLFLARIMSRQFDGTS